MNVKLIGKFLDIISKHIDPLKSLGALFSYWQNQLVFELPQFWHNLKLIN